MATPERAAILQYTINKDYSLDQSIFEMRMNSYSMVVSGMPAVSTSFANHTVIVTWSPRLFQA